jgi:hypothetical protein
MAAQFQPTRRRRVWVFFFLAAIVTIAATLLGAATASAATTTGPENRVRAHTEPAAVFAGVAQPVTAGQRPGNQPPGAVIAVATSVATNGASKFSGLAHSSAGIAPYSTQRLVTAGHGGEIQAHHLIEKRFAAVMGQRPRDMSAIIVTQLEHRAFTNAWRATIPYRGRNVTPTMVNDAARYIYRDYPEILRGLGLG